MARLKLFTLLILIGLLAACYLVASRSGLFDKQLPNLATDNNVVLPFEVLTRLQSGRLNESSGVVLSERYPNAVWTHNDSGSRPHVYLVSTRTGKILIDLKLDGAASKDWEDITYFTHEKGAYIVVGDVGDNHKIRRQCQMYIIPEPKVELTEKGGAKKVVSRDWLKYPFRYQQGSRNCESIAYDPESKSILLVEKITSREKGNSGVYRLKLFQDKLANKQVPIAEKIGEIQGSNYSAMDISRDGNRMVLRVYNAGFFLEKPASESWDQFLTKPFTEWHRLPPQLQGEGVCFYPDGTSVLLSSEREASTLIRVSFPEE